MWVSGQLHVVTASPLGIEPFHALQRVWVGLIAHLNALE